MAKLVELLFVEWFLLRGAVQMCVVLLKGAFFWGKGPEGVVFIVGFVVLFLPK